jgi:hypothetical protein
MTSLSKNEQKKISDFAIDFYVNFHFFDIFGENSDISSLLVTQLFHDAQTSKNKSINKIKSITHVFGCVDN